MSVIPLANFHVSGAQCIMAWSSYFYKALQSRRCSLYCSLSMGCRYMPGLVNGILREGPTKVDQSAWQSHACHLSLIIMSTKLHKQANNYVN